MKTLAGPASKLELARVLDPALNEDYGRFVRYAYVLQCGLEVSGSYQYFMHIAATWQGLHGPRAGNSVLYHNEFGLDVILTYVL